MTTIAFVETAPNLWYIFAEEHVLSEEAFVSLADAMRYAVDHLIATEYVVEYWGWDDGYSGA